MSQSPLTDEVSTPQKIRDSYLNNWNELATLIRQGQSLSGRERNCCFLNVGDERSHKAAGFADVSSAVGLDLIDDGRGLAIVDWDHDGDLDIWLSNRTGPRVRLMINEFAEPRGFLSLVLQGTDCNRDAIGARVELELEGDNRPRVQTLRAAESFLSQSSKTIHFGLGGATDIVAVRVRWPGSTEPQEFVGLRPNGRYRLVQGRSEPEMLTARPRIRFEHGAIPLSSSNSTSRTVLSQRRTLPAMEWNTFDGARGRLSGNSPATWVNLWASWCQPCLAELDQIAKHAERLKTEGVRVVLLSVDSDLDHARRVYRRMKLPFDVGIAAESTLRDLAKLDREIFYRYRPLPLPCSFLLDAQENVAVVYKGPIAPEQLMADAARVNAPAARMAEESRPFVGRNIAAWFSPGAVNVANAYLEGGYADDALRVLRRFLQQPISNVERIQALRLLASVGRTQNDTALELESLRQLLAAQPDDETVQLQWVAVLHRTQQLEEVQEYLARLEEAAKQDAGLLVRLGQFYMSTGAEEMAIERIERAVSLEPGNVDARLSLAIARQLTGDVAAAITQYEAILQDHPDLLEAANNLAWLLSTHPTTTGRRDEAVQLARRVCRESNESHPAFLDTLAVTLEATGDMSSAKEVLGRAIALAQARGETTLARKLQGRLNDWASRDSESR